MRARQGIAAAIVAGLTAVAVALPASAAVAADFEGTPPSAFLDCEDFPEVGGWVGFRDTTVLGTEATEPSPVRPRNVRFGEPCVEAGAIAIPARLSDLPVPMLDEDEDGQDDGPPSSGEPCATSGDTTVTQAEIAAETTTCTDAYGSITQSGTVLGVTPGTVRFGDIVENSPQSVSITALGPAGDGAWVTPIPGYSNSPVHVVRSSVDGMCYNPSTLAYTSASGGAAFTDFSTSHQAFPFTRTITCTAPAVVYAIYIRALPNTYHADMPWGVAWRNDDPPTGGDQIGTGYYGGTQAAQFVVPGNSDWMSGGSFITCSTEYGIEPTITHDVGSPFGDPIGFSDTPPDEGSWTVNGTIALDVATSACPFLHSMRIVICGFVDHDPSQYGCTAMLWSSAQFNDGRAYDGTDPDEAICTLYPSLPGCYEVLHPPTIDGTDFGVVCAGAPEPAWLDFSWLPALIGHFAHCLFVPVNGWDRLGWVDTAIANSGLTQVAESVGSIAGAATVPPNSCGVLIDASAHFDGFVVDTCDWSFPPEAKQVLHYLVLIVGGLWILTTAWNVGPGAVLGAKVPIGDRGDDE